MRVRIAIVLFGIAFGFLLSWGRFTDPDMIQGALLLGSAYLFLMMGSAVAVGFVGIRLARRYLGRAILTGQQIAWSVQKPEPAHVWGSVLFGLGWAVSDACPGPITAQLGQGFGWSLFTAIGMAGGVLIYLRLQEPAPATAPAPEHASVAPLVPASAPE